ncbi:hypothetical protein MMC21_006846 [Puttea exsequens]|nr:hypothetical protein [Puttea exsequens]
MRARRRWTEEEDHILTREATLQLKRGALKQWNLIADNLPGRTNKDCRKRWAKLGNEVKKGAWSSDEDEKLQSAIAQFGFKWTQVAEIVGTRHAEQCAKRWQHSLDPSVDHSKWDNNEDQALMEGVTKHGRNWKTIRSERLPHRSTTDIKNRHTMLVRKPQSDTTSNQTREPSPKYSTTEQFFDDDFMFNDPIWDEESSRTTDMNQILPDDTFDALFPPLDLNTTTISQSILNNPLHHQRHDSGVALSSATTSASSSNGTEAILPSTTDMYCLNMNPLASGMWPADWVASPKEMPSTSPQADFSSSNTLFSTTNDALPSAYSQTSNPDDYLWPDSFPAIPPPNPLWPSTTTTITTTSPPDPMALDDTALLDEEDPGPPTPNPTRENSTEPSVQPPSLLREFVPEDGPDGGTGRQQRDAKGRTTLVLEDVEPETLKTVIDTLFQSKTKMSMTH